jgi:3-hydroxyacyl-[acyl-carrier-protein] dehydratase
MMEQSVDNPILDVKEISKILPHRYPFLLLDRITFIDLKNNKIIGQKNVTINEPFFVGHFPTIPIMPGVFILEALAQTAGVLVGQKLQADKIAVFLTIDNVKFRKAVTPGDVLLLHMEGEHISSKGGRFLGKAFVDNFLVAEAKMSFGLVSRDRL